MTIDEGKDAEDNGCSDSGSIADDDPLLPSLSKKRVQMGSFSIRYNDPSSLRVKPSRSYEDPSSVEGECHRPSPSTAQPLTSAFRDGCFLPLRILLLALHLAFTLSSFWILDSVKEPTLAILVDGDLERHQPRAKMVSFVVVLGMAVAMERARCRGAREGRGAARPDDEEGNAEIARSWAARDLPTSIRDGDGNGGVRWNKMAVATSRVWDRLRGRHRGSGDDESKITTLAFYVVGSFYIHAFAVVAVALRAHPAFRPGGDAPGPRDGGDAPGAWSSLALGYAFFALVESYGSVALVVFWSFANSHLTLAAAERHYGAIVALAQAGAIGGSTLAAVLGRRRDRGAGTPGGGDAGDGGGDARATPVLILWACGCVGGGMALMALYARLFAGPMAPGARAMEEGGAAREEDPPPRSSELPRSEVGKDGSRDGGTDLLGGLRMIFRHEYLKLILAVSVLYEISLTCLHYEMNLIGLHRFGGGVGVVDDAEFNNEQYGYDHTNPSDDKDTPPKEGFDADVTFIQFLGWYGQTVNILSLFLSFFVFPRLLKHCGLTFTIRVFPTVLLIVTVSAFVIFPRNLYFLFVSLGICKALTYSVHDPAQEMLYMPTSDDAKFRAKFWIDVVGQRIAKALGAAINNYAGSVEGIVKYGSVPSVVASLVLWLACYQVGILFDRLIKSGGVVGLEDEEQRHAHGLELCEDMATGDDSGGANREDTPETPRRQELLSE